MKNLIYFLLIASSILLSANSFAINVNLFQQPEQNDNSCGIRQTLIAAHVLKQENTDSFTGDIISTWNFYDNIFHREYNKYLRTESCNIPSLFTNNVPANETSVARAKTNGGPMTLPSALIQTAQGQQSIKAVKIYLYEPLLEEFFDSFYITPNISLLDYEVQLLKDIGIETITMQEKLCKENFPSPNSGKKYFQLLINNGQHWIGTTTTTTYDSLTNGPVNFDPKKVFDDFAGIMIEYEYQGTN